MTIGADAGGFTDPAVRPAVRTDGVPDGEKNGISVQGVPRTAISCYTVLESGRIVPLFGYQYMI